MSLSKHQLGQYFTEDISLQRKVFEFVKNKPNIILEPSIGRGDLIHYVKSIDDSITFHMYEIDESIEMLSGISKDNIRYGDFLEQVINEKYNTIIGNPPYVKTKSGNLYIDFIERCYDLLEDDGELIFIVPSDFLKLTSASTLLNTILANGTITDIYHPNDEHLFKNASIDVIVFRYQKSKHIKQICIYNDEEKFLVNNNGMITFCNDLTPTVSIDEYFDVYVGMVSGKETVFKSSAYGNIKILNAESKIDSYVFLKEFPSAKDSINQYLLQHKDELMSRRIRKFNDDNWYQWGAPRNISVMESFVGQDCIYMYNLTRKSNVAFLGKVQYFGGNLIMLKPKSTLELGRFVDYFNGSEFKKNFEFSGRFKIGQRQLANMQIPDTLVK